MLPVSSERFENQEQQAGGRFLSGGYECMVGGGELGALMRSYNWSETAFGPVEQWSQSLRSVLSICLNSRFPIAIYWGADSLLLYNDAWRPIVGDKHPWALGRPAREVWAEIWDDIGPELASVLATGEGIFHNDECLAMHRFGYTEECFFDYTFNPIQGEGGVVNGVLNIGTETTYRVLNDRRTRLSREIAFRTGTAKTVEEASALIIEALRSDPADIPFALLYLTQPDGRSMTLVGSTEVDVSPAIAPSRVALAQEESKGWPIATVARQGESQIVRDLISLFGHLTGSPWPEPPQEALVLPIALPGQGKGVGVLVAVASPRRRLDEAYCDFLSQVSLQAAMAIANARSYNDERQRAEQLLELDRAKTVFFSNVSHEFRTPLTLMLGPVEDALRETQNDEQRDRLELIHRNTLRLQKLVNTLLDFSRIEANRLDAVYRPTDLATLTSDLASVFRSAIERVHLSLHVDCPPLPEPVYVDWEMWEKIVLNLLSNAFKFTFEGEISVKLGFYGDHVELEVRDTGIGIPPEELPHVFERFHRVQGARGRTYEGSGIGLSLVQELVSLHGGTITAESVINQGTSFTVSIPTGWIHLPGDRVQHSTYISSLPDVDLPQESPVPAGAIPYITEALRWISSEHPVKQTPETATEPAETAKPLPQVAIAPRIVLADDNDDMRDYVQRLLNPTYVVDAVGDGATALTAIHRQLPDLVLTDVMMPSVDGFSLLQQLRADPRTQDLPIILLSARAGEESRLEGLEAGADDYLVKPFSARELLVRVETTLKLAQMRQEVARYEQALRIEAEAGRERVSVILDSITDAFIALDRNWRYTYANDQATKILRRTRDELLGKQVWAEVFPSRVDTLSYRELHRALNEQVPVTYEDFNAALGMWFEVHAYPSQDGLAVYFQDISDRKRAELMLIEQTRLLEFIAAGQPLHECLSAICTSVSTLNPRIRACFLIADAQQQSFPSLVMPDFPPSLAESLRGASINELFLGTCLKMVYLGQPVTCVDIAKDERWSQEWCNLCVAHGMLACHSTPVFDADGKALGSLMLTFSEARSPTDWEYQLSDFGSQIASIAFERDRATLALLESEHRYRMLFESIDEGFCICEVLLDENSQPVDYRFLKVNPAFEKLTGLADVVGKTARDVVPNLEPFWIETYGQVALTGEPIRFEHESIAMNRWFDVNAFPVGEPQKHRLAILFTNVTDRKRFEQERERFLSVGSDLQVVSSSNGIFQWVSPTFERILGWTAEEMTSRPWIEFVHPDDIEKSISENSHLFSGNKTSAFENRYRCKDGSYRWFLWNAQSYPTEQVTYAVAVDITDRKQIEDTLRQREAELSLVTNAVPALISFVDANQCYRFNNHRYEEWFGQRAEEIYGKHLKKVLGEAAYEEVRPYVEKVLAGHQVTFERRLPYRDGEPRYVSATYVPRFNASGGVEGFVALVHDISDRKQAEQDREQLLDREREARETAEAANRVKDEFLAVLSHELRSPLNPILGWSRLLQHGNLDEAKTQQALATIERNARLQSELIEDLLDVSRILRGKLSLAVSPVALSSTIQAAIETVRLAAEAKSIQIKTHLDPTVGLVAGDPTRLQQVVWNLLSNGVKFTPPGGQVEVRLEQVDQQAQITVSDTGKGITPDFLPHVFEYFRQEDSATTRKFGGLGLGLAIVRHLIELHGGTIDADSQGEGLGSTFTVWLPLMQRQPPVTTYPPVPNQPMDLNNVRVLVVDDDADTRDLVVFLLEQSGAVVTAAASANDALSALKQSPPDVLISDIGMPGTDGYMLIQRIRALPPNQGGEIPAIALTAYAGDFNQQRSLQAGFQQHLAKPIEPDDLLVAVASLAKGGAQAKM